MARVLAIVVTYNAMKWVDGCLGSLFDSSERPDVLVVDNGSTDGTRDYVRNRYPRAELVLCEGNPGFGAANNIGLRLAAERGSEFVYLLNQDAWVFPDTIGTLVRAMRMRPDFGILSPVQKNAAEGLDRQFERKCGRYLSATASVSADSTTTHSAAVASAAAASTTATAAIAGGAEAVEVPFVMAAHWLMSVETIRRVGGFSPAFRQYGEDDNYIDRLHYNGLRCGVVPAAAAVHDRSSRPDPKERRMRLKCIAVTVRLSDPRRSFALRLCLLPFELVGMSLKNFSLAPLRFAPELLSRLPELFRLRCASKERGAFL